VSEDRTIKVFSIVPGATIVGNATGKHVTAGTTTDVSGVSVEYSKRVETTNGTFSATVPYPGEYTVEGDTVRVSEAAVLNGTSVERLGD
jgi:dolichyl-diphosphooligosaccharide--protein glycosyltransferase